MRRIVRVSLLAASVLVSAAWPRGKEPKAAANEPKGPLFAASDFRFSQVDTICVPPVLDVRLDKTDTPLGSANKPGHRWGDPDHPRGTGPSDINTDLAAWFKYVGYPMTPCKPVDGTLDDLKAPMSDSWLAKLDFGASRWLFLLAVEDTNTKSHFLNVNPLQKKEGGHAVVSGYLFDRQAAGKLDWRHRVVGEDTGVKGAEHQGIGPMAPGGNIFIGGPEGGKVYEAEMAIRDGERKLLSFFEMRTAKRPLNGGNWREDKPCSGKFQCAMWSALDRDQRHPQERATIRHHRNLRLGHDGGFRGRPWR